MRIENPFHEGELDVQRRAGELDEGRRNGRAIADSVMRGAIPFVEKQSLVVVGSVDPSGGAWVSLVFGAPGFVRVPDERRIEIDLSRAILHDDDPLLTDLERDPRAGLLFIELETRRRLRVNGRVENAGKALRVAVEESYPNCPKYIQRRLLRSTVDPANAASSRLHADTELRAEVVALVRRSDTFFVASSNPDGGVDVSHRGGSPGFIQVMDERTLRIPDYEGNRMYNTLGNFVRNPGAGVTFLDFETGRLLMLNGRARVVWDDGTSTTGRSWDLEIDRTRELALPVKLEWEFLDPSPNNPARTGE